MLSKGHRLACEVFGRVLGFNSSPFCLIFAVIKSSLWWFISITLLFLLDLVLQGTWFWYEIFRQCSVIYVIRTDCRFLSLSCLPFFFLSPRIASDFWFRQAGNFLPYFRPYLVLSLLFIYILIFTRLSICYCLRIWNSFLLYMHPKRKRPQI